MKYRDLFQLNPIEDVIKIAEVDRQGKAQQLVSTFVITPSLGTEIERVALPILDPKSTVEGKGLFVVGNYGTGKSHLMSFLSILAENAEALAWLRDAGWREKLSPIAGKYKVRRCEINVVDPASMTLYDVVAEQLGHLAKAEAIGFEFAPSSKVSNPKDEFARFMEAFEAKQPDLGVLLIFDEVLDHLRRLNDSQLVRDLAVLRALGEFADGSRLKFMAGVQRSLFSSDEFHHVASEIGRIRQRFNDMVIDSKGVEQLIDTYLFEKDESQRARIKALLLKQAPLYETVGQDIDRFVRLFPAHPRFIEEFERVSVVERREILKVLSAEARLLAERELGEEVPQLITSDRYWGHIECDSGLDANAEVRKVKQNVATLKDRIKTAMAPEDRAPANRLVEALAVNRLTTSSVSAQVGLTPNDLKESLLWYAPITMADPMFLTLQAKRTLDKTKEAANGQFLAKAPNSDHYFIDPTLNRDYEQEVHTEARTISAHVVQRHLNQIVLNALEIDRETPIAENRLWNYNLDWVEKRTERPGWLFFGFPNLRLTAQPPKDFYIFLCPSSRIERQRETIQDADDEAYWTFEDFPTSKAESKDEAAPDTWLDTLRLYAAARERESRLTAKSAEEKTAFRNIAERHLGDLLPELNHHANEWVSVQHRGARKTLGDWMQEVDPNNVHATFKTKLRSLTQWMFSSWFDQKYRDYPVFPTRQTEDSRNQNARMAQEMIARVGFGVKGTDQGRGVLNGLGLYQSDKPSYDSSRWLQEVKRRLQTIGEGQFLNASDLFEERDGRSWFKGEPIEAEWLTVVLSAGAAEGDLVIVGKGNSQYDASKLEELFSAIRSPSDVVRIAKPKGRPVEEWKRLFDVLGLPKGELAHDVKLDGAVVKFVNACNERIERIVRTQQALAVPLPFQSDDSTAVLAESGKALGTAKDQLEGLKTLNSRAKMTNLSLGSTEIERLSEHLAICNALESLVTFKAENDVALGAVGRYEAILDGLSPTFATKLETLKEALNEVYASPPRLSDVRAALVEKLDSAKVEALKTYQGLHRRHRLGTDDVKRKSELVNGSTMKRLNRLAEVESLGHAKLDAIFAKIERLVPYKGASDEVLLKSSTSLNPDGFDPRTDATEESAADQLAKAEAETHALFDSWQSQLLKELGTNDPSVQGGFSALAQDDRKKIDAFLSAKALPEEIDRSFVSAVNSLLKGLRRKPISREGLVKAVFGGGGPLRPEELLQKVQDWLKEQTRDEDATQVRFVLED